MKAILLVSAIACAVATPTRLITQDNLDDLGYMNGIFYNMWNGFVRGLYREHTITVVDKNCFGDWVQKNLTHLDDVTSRIFDFSFDITFDEAKEAAVDVVNLIYKNMDYCGFKKVYTDMYTLCGDDLSCLDYDVFTNI